MFLLIGGEGEENPGWLQAGALHDYAKQFGGLSDFDEMYQGELEGGRNSLKHRIKYSTVKVGPCLLHSCCWLCFLFSWYMQANWFHKKFSLLPILTDLCK